MIKALVVKIGVVLTWFGVWLLLMVVGLSLFYHPEPLWVTKGMSVWVQPLCIVLLGIVLKHGIAKNIPSTTSSKL